MAVLIIIAISLFVVSWLSSYWCKVNEFNQLFFPQMQAYSLYAGIAFTALAVFYGAVTNIKLSKEIADAKVTFWYPYEEYSDFASHYINIENDIDKQIEIILSENRTYGVYRVRALKIDDQLRMELNKLRSGDSETKIKIFGTSAIALRPVYVRSEYTEMSDEELMEAYENGGITFELYYVDTEARSQAEERYKEIIATEYKDKMTQSEQDQLLRSYMEQFDTDRQFDVGKEFKFTLNDADEVEFSDEVRKFISLEESNGNVQSEKSEETLTENLDDSN